MSKKTSILDKEIAKLLKSTREKAGLYQAEIAKRIDFSAKWGERKKPFGGINLKENLFTEITENAEKVELKHELI